MMNNETQMSFEDTSWSFFASYIANTTISSVPRGSVSLISQQAIERNGGGRLRRLTLKESQLEEYVTLKVDIAVEMLSTLMLNTSFFDQMLTSAVLDPDYIEALQQEQFFSQSFIYSSYAPAAIQTDSATNGDDGIQKKKNLKPNYAAAIIVSVFCTLIVVAFSFATLLLYKRRKGRIRFNGNDVFYASSHRVGNKSHMRYGTNQREYEKKTISLGGKNEKHGPYGEVCFPYNNQGPFLNSTSTCKEGFAFNHVEEDFESLSKQSRSRSQNSSVHFRAGKEGDENAKWQALNCVPPLIVVENIEVHDYEQGMYSEEETENSARSPPAKSVTSPKSMLSDASVASTPIVMQRKLDNSTQVAHRRSQSAGEVNKIQPSEALERLIREEWSQVGHLPEHRADEGVDGIDRVAQELYMSEPSELQNTHARSFSDPELMSSDKWEQRRIILGRSDSLTASPVSGSAEIPRPWSHLGKGSDSFATSPTTSWDLVTYSRSNSRGSQGFNQPWADEKTEYRYTFDAPSRGKLGLIIESSKHHGPTVHTVKDYSPLFGMVQPGDKIIMVEGHVTSRMSTGEITQLLARTREKKEDGMIRLTLLSAIEKVGIPCNDEKLEILQRQRYLVEKLEYKTIAEVDAMQYKTVKGEALPLTIEVLEGGDSVLPTRPNEVIVDDGNDVPRFNGVYSDEENIEDSFHLLGGLDNGGSFNYDADDQESF